MKSALGTHVASGEGRAVAVGLDADTELGRVGADLRSRDPVTAYERGITAFGYLLVRLMLVLTGFIYVVNTAFGRPIVEALLFSLALAVGLTPQMLPAIVTLSLSAGARRMARSRVIVKRLDAIEDFGSMAILCTDKTGTLTEGAPQLDLALDLAGRESAEVLELGAINAGLQTGFANPMDAAILARHPASAAGTILAEVPYDFSRKRLSVATMIDGEATLVVKGAFDGVLACCTHASRRGGGGAGPGRPRHPRPIHQPQCRRVPRAGRGDSQALLRPADALAPTRAPRRACRVLTGRRCEASRAHVMDAA